MKRFFLYILLIALSANGLVALAQTPTISIKKGKFIINNVDVNANWKSAPLINNLGNSHRVIDKFNKVYTYDDLGIVVFESKKDEVGTGDISEVQFYYLVPDKNSVTPNGTFSGKLKVENLTVSSLTNAKKLLAKLKKYKKSDSYSAHNYRLAYEGIYIYFLFNDDETILHKVSVGRDKGN